jgi:hypothetical protein
MNTMDVENETISNVFDCDKEPSKSCKGCEIPSAQQCSTAKSSSSTHVSTSVASPFRSAVAIDCNLKLSSEIYDKEVEIQETVLTYKSLSVSFLFVIFTTPQS